MKNNYIGIFLIVFTSFGCSTPTSLTKAGKNVKLVNQLPTDAKYDELDPISCSYGGNGRAPATNMISCRNDLRNQAAMLGADIVVLDAQQLGTDGGMVMGGTGVIGCPNCISMTGTPYKKKSK